MSDDELERRLDRMYRSLDDSAQRVQSRWRARPGTRRRARIPAPSFGAWAGAGAAAAAAIMLLILALRSESSPVVELVRAPIPVAPPEPRPVPPVAPPPLPVAPTAPPPATPPPATAAPRTPSPSDPEPEPPKAPPAPPSGTLPPPVPPAGPPRSTAVAKSSAVIREIDGSLDLADRPLRGRQKDVTIASGDRLRTSTVVRLGLAEDRFVLLSPKTVVEFRPEEKRITLALEQGEALAELVGPGPEIRVVTRSCEVTPLGTVFAVKVVPGRSIVTVEKGRVDVQSPKGKTTLRASESVQAGDDGTLGTPAPADFRALAWARGHRPSELTLYAEDFSKPGAWEGEIDKGVARAAARPGAAPILHLATDKPLFEVPVRGVLSIVCRADRASRLKVQIFAGDVRTTFRVEVPVLRSSEWRTLSFNFDEFVPSDRTKAGGRPAPGAPITDLLLQYGEEDERGSFWVNAIKVTEGRP